MSNPLILPIEEGRIRDLADLKSTYRSLLEQINSDGSNFAKAMQKYLESNKYYEEAKAYLAKTDSDIALSIETYEISHRLEFYKQLHFIELIETQNGTQTEGNQKSISTNKEMAREALSNWKPGVVDLWAKADAELTIIKKESPTGLHHMHSLAVTIRPLIENIIAFHLSGNEAYAWLSRLSLDGIMQKIAVRGFRSLYGFITFIIEDLKNGVAAFD